MTGRELIMYILDHKLENEDLFKNGLISVNVLGLISIEEAALMIGSGTATVKASIATGLIPGVCIDSKWYVEKSKIQGGSK